MYCMQCFLKSKYIKSITFNDKNWWIIKKVMVLKKMLPHLATRSTYSPGDWRCDELWREQTLVYPPVMCRQMLIYCTWELNVIANDLPEELIKFLNVISGGKPQVSCAKANRIILSIEQDICWSVTDGEWKLPRHILLYTTIKHLYRNKQTTSILSILGRRESYGFGWELETAQATALEEVSSLLTP